MCQLSGMAPEKTVFGTVPQRGAATMKRWKNRAKTHMLSVHLAFGLKLEIKILLTWAFVILFC